MDYKGLSLVTMIARLPLDIRCPSRHRIRNDMLDQAFRRMIARHGDLQSLRRFPLRAFFVWPGLVSNVVRDQLLLIISRVAIVDLMLDRVESTWKRRRHRSL
jgi:hypothetical protein